LLVGANSVFLPPIDDARAINQSDGGDVSSGSVSWLGKETSGDKITSMGFCNAHCADEVPNSWASDLIALFVPLTLNDNEFATAPCFHINPTISSTTQNLSLVTHLPKNVGDVLFKFLWGHLLQIGEGAESIQSNLSMVLGQLLFVCALKRNDLSTVYSSLVHFLLKVFYVDIDRLEVNPDKRRDKEH